MDRFGRSPLSLCVPDSDAYQEIRAHDGREAGGLFKGLRALASEHAEPQHARVTGARGGPAETSAGERNSSAPAAWSLARTARRCVGNVFAYLSERGTSAAKFLGLEGGPADTRKPYQGPRLWAVTVEDLESAPRPWSEFVGKASEIGACYRLPRTFAEVPDRLEENVVYFLPNYLRLVGITACIVMAQRPGGILGLGLIFAARQMLHRVIAAHAEAARRRAASGVYQGWDQWVGAVLVVLMWLVPWLIGAKTQGMAGVLRGVQSGATAGLVHALFRVPASQMREVRTELRRGPKRVLGFEASQDEVLRSLGIPTEQAGPVGKAKRA